MSCAINENPISIIQYSDVSFTLYAYDQTKDANGSIVSENRMDLTGKILIFELRDSDDNIIFRKTSANVAEILINPDQASPDTKGTATIYIYGSDTSTLTTGEKYYFDVWVEDYGIQYPITKKSVFTVLDGVYKPVVGVPPSIPASTAPQTPQERSFKWTALSAGSVFVVHIPGAGMVDSTYSISMSYSTIAGSTYPSIVAQESNRTQTQFMIETSSPIASGTVIDFILRDS